MKERIEPFGIHPSICRLDLMFTAILGLMFGSTCMSLVEIKISALTL